MVFIYHFLLLFQEFSYLNLKKIGEGDKEDEKKEKQKRERKKEEKYQEKEGE